MTQDDGIQYPDNWTTGDQYNAVLKANRSYWESVGTDAEAQAGAALSQLVGDTLPLMSHPDPSVRDATAELLLNMQADRLRREAGQGPLGGSFGASMRRKMGSVFNAMSPVHSEVIGQDFGDRVKAAQTLSEFLNVGYQPMTKGYWKGREELKDSITTDLKWSTLDGESFYVDKEAASQAYKYDREKLQHDHQMKDADRQETVDGRSFVETVRGKWEIPTHVQGRDGKSYSITEKADSILMAMRGVDPEGPGTVIGDRGIFGSIYYDYGSDMVEGVHRDIDVGGGEFWPFVPNITGDFDVDRANLMDPAYRRALTDAAGEASFWGRASLSGGAMMQELAEYLTVAGALKGVAKGGRAVFMGGRHADDFLRGRSIAKDRILGPSISGAEAATAGARAGAKNGIPTFLKWNTHDAINEVALGVSQSMAEGGTAGEGVVRGLGEVAIERGYAVAGRAAGAPIWLSGRALGRRLPSVGDLLRRSSIPRGQQSELNAAIQRYGRKSFNDVDQITNEMMKTFRDRSMVEWGKTMYDVAWMSMGLASHQVAMEQAAAQGVNWDDLSLEAKAKWIVGAANDAKPEMLGNWMAMMAGASPAMAGQFSGVRGYWQYANDDGAQLSMQTKVILDMAQKNFGTIDEEGAKDFLVLNRHWQTDERHAEVTARNAPRPEDSLNPPSAQEMVRVLEESTQVRMTIDGSEWTEAAMLTEQEMYDYGALSNSGRLLEYETEVLSPRKRDIKDSGMTMIPLTTSSASARYIDPKTGEERIADSFHNPKNVPPDFKQVADYNWGSPSGEMSADANQVRQALMAEDGQAQQLYEEARRAYINESTPISVPDQFHFSVPTRSQGERGEKVVAESVDRQLARIPKVNSKIRKSKVFREPFEAAALGAPADVAIPAIAKKLLGLLPKSSKIHKRKRKEDLPLHELGGLSAQEMATSIFQELTSGEQSRADRLISRVDTLLAAFSPRQRPGRVGRDEISYEPIEGDREFLGSNDHRGRITIDEGAIKKHWDAKTEGMLHPFIWVKDPGGSWRLERLDYEWKSYEEFRRFVIEHELMHSIHAQKENESTETYENRINSLAWQSFKNRMGTRELLARGSAEAVAQLRQAALDAVRTIEAFADLPSQGQEAEGILGALVRRDAALAKLFEAQAGATGKAQFDAAADQASKAVQAAQEVALLLSSHWPAQYNRMRLAIRALDALHTKREMPKWLLRRARQAGILEETKNGGFTIRPGAVEGVLQDVQAWTRVAGIETDVVSALSGWTHADKPIPIHQMEQAMASIPGVEEGDFRSRWEKFIDWVDPKGYSKLLTFWIPKSLKTAVLRESNKLAPVYWRGRSEQAQAGGEAWVRDEQRAVGRFVERRNRLTQLLHMMDEYMERPGVNKDHRRFLTELIHAGTFRVVQTKEDFVARYDDMVNGNAGALYDIAMRWVDLMNELGMAEVAVGTLTPDQFKKWQSKYIKRPKLDTDEYYESETKRRTGADGPLRTSSNLSRVDPEPNVMRLMDFTMIGPAQVMQRSAQLRWMETMFNAWQARDGRIIRRGDVPPEVLQRDYQPLVQPANLPENWEFTDNYVSRGMWDFFQQLREQLEPVRDSDGNIAPDGEKIRQLRLERGWKDNFWTGLGTSDPNSPWFENSRPAGGRERESHGQDFPRTERLTQFLDSMVSIDRDQLEATGEVAPNYFVDTNTHELLHNLINEIYRETSTFQQTMHESIAIFRRMKTMYSPKHWIMNFFSSLTLNWTSGGVGPLDFIRGSVFKSGDYWEANRLLALWRRSMSQEELAQFGGDKQAMVASWSHKDRADLAMVEEYLSLSGGATLTGAVLDPLTVENLTDALIEGEVTAQDLLPENHSNKTFRLLSRQLQRFASARSPSARVQNELFSSGQRKEMARALHSVSAEYASVEHFFKLANALHLRRKRGLDMATATRMGARGTSDYAGTSQIISDWTTNWRGVWHRAEAPVFEKARGDIEGFHDKAQEHFLKPFTKFYFGNVFWMFNAGALPAQMRGAFTHPWRTMAATAMASSVAYGVMKALGTDSEEERVREALHEMYGMEEWSLVSEEDLNGILDELENLMGGNTMVSFAGGEYRDDAIEVFRRLLSTQPFRGVSLPKEGRSRVFSTEDAAPLAVRMALDLGNNVGSLVQGHYPKGSEKKSFMQGFLPAAIKGNIGFLHDLVKNHRGETGMEHAVRAIQTASRQFGAAFHPVTMWASPETVGVIEAANAQSINGMVRGIPTPEWERQSLGSRMTEFGLNRLFKTRTVHSFPADVDEREMLMAQRIIENLFPDLSSNVKGTREEKLLARAMRNSMEMTVKTMRSAYQEHFHYSAALEQGKALGFDQILAANFMITRDMDFMGPDAQVGQWATTPIGRFIAAAKAEDPEYGYYVEAAASRMVRDYVFADKRWLTLVDLGRKRLVDPATFELLAKGLMDSSGSMLVEVIHREVVGQKNTNDLRALYNLFGTIDPKTIRGVLGKQRSKEVYEVFAANGMLRDWSAPSEEDLNTVLGSKKWSLIPHQTIRTLESR